MVRTTRTILFGGLVAAALSNHSLRAEETPVNVSFQYTIHGVELQIADEKGWWKEIGLKPGSMTPFVAGAPQVAAVASNSWDIGLMGGPPALLGASRFKLQTVLLLIDDARANELVVKKSDAPAVKSDAVKALKGRQYLTPVNSTADYTAQACFAKWGLNPGDLQAINIAPGAIVDAFRGGDVAAAAIWAPHFQRLEADAGGEGMCNGKEAGVIVPANMVVRPDYLKDHLDTVARFAALYLRGVHFMKTNRAETLGIMKRFYDKGGVVLSPKEMDAEYDTRDYFDLAQQMQLFDRSQGPSKMDSAHEKLASFFLKAGTISQMLDPKAFINPIVLDAITKDPKLKAFAEGR